jgi:hypothetical protein
MRIQQLSFGTPSLVLRLFRFLQSLSLSLALTFFLSLSLLGSLPIGSALFGGTHHCTQHCRCTLLREHFEPDQLPAELGGTSPVQLGQAENELALHAHVDSVMAAAAEGQLAAPTTPDHRTLADTLASGIF